MKHWVLLLLAAFLASASAMELARLRHHRHHTPPSPRSCPVEFGHENLHNKWIEICEENKVERRECKSWFNSACYCYHGHKQHCEAFVSATLDWDIQNNPHFQDVDDRVFILWSGVSQKALEHVYSSNNKVLPITLATAQQLLVSVNPLMAFYDPPKESYDVNTKIVWSVLSEQFIELAFQFSPGKTTVLLLFGQYYATSIFAQTEAMVLKEKNDLVDIQIRVLADFKKNKSEVPAIVQKKFQSAVDPWIHPCEVIEEHVKQITELDDDRIVCYSECDSYFNHCVDHKGRRVLDLAKLIGNKAE